MTVFTGRRQAPLGFRLLAWIRPGVLCSATAETRPSIACQIRGRTFTRQSKGWCDCWRLRHQLFLQEQLSPLTPVLQGLGIVSLFSADSPNLPPLSHHRGFWLRRYLLEKEFGSDKPGLEGWGPEGSWPHWWRGVASVYAANLAAHVVFPDFDKSYMCAPGDTRIQTLKIKGTSGAEELQIALALLRCCESTELQRRLDF